MQLQQPWIQNQEMMATNNKMDMNVKKGIVYAQNYVGGEFEDAAAGYVDSYNPVRMLIWIWSYRGLWL